MSIISINSAKNAKAAGEEASVKRSGLRWMDDLLAVAIEFWPRKTASNLAATTKVSERAAEFWLAGKYDMSLGAARELLRTEDGFDYLVALVGADCDAKWFQHCKMAHELGVSNRRLKAEQKRLEKLKQQRDQIAMKFDE